MKTIMISLACGLILALGGNAYAQDAPPPAPAAAPKIALVNPHAELVKAIKPTDVQKNLLENMDAGAATRVQETFTALAVFVGTKRVAISLTPKYVQRFAEAEKLEGEEAIEAKKKVWIEIAKEIRPEVEKEALKQVRAAMMTYFRDAEQVVTAAQKPAFKETKARVEKNFDKELPALCKIVALKVMEESFAVVL